MGQFMGERETLSGRHLLSINPNDDLFPLAKNEPRYVSQVGRWLDGNAASADYPFHRDWWHGHPRLGEQCIRELPNPSVARL